MECIQDNMNSTGEGSDLHGSATEKSNITVMMYIAKKSEI